jgi:hypothetical protein
MDTGDGESGRGRGSPARELDDAGALGEGYVGDAEDGEDAAHGVPAPARARLACRCSPPPPARQPPCLFRPKAEGAASGLEEDSRVTDGGMVGLAWVGGVSN